jgi:aspartate 1-decarboxylase
MRTLLKSKFHRTYGIEAENNSGTVCINEPAAYLDTKDNPAIVLIYCCLEDTEIHNSKPSLVYVASRNTTASARQAIEH